MAFSKFVQTLIANHRADDKNKALNHSKRNVMERSMHEKIKHFDCQNQILIIRMHNGLLIITWCVISRTDTFFKWFNNMI